jgi:hypothetical protein
MLSEVALMATRPLCRATLNCLPMQTSTLPNKVNLAAFGPVTEKFFKPV